MKVEKTPLGTASPPRRLSYFSRFPVDRGLFLHDSAIPFYWRSLDKMPTMEKEFPISCRTRKTSEIVAFFGGIVLQGPKLERMIGRVLKSDLIDIYGAIVIPKNRVIQARDVQKAMLHPIEMLPEYKELKYREVLMDVVHELLDVFQHVRDLNELPIEEIQETVFPHVEELVHAPDVNQLLLQLQEVDDYTVAHSVAVGVLASFLGRWLGMEENELKALTQAATLHDIGKMQVPLDILNKPGALTLEEYNLVKQHTVHGYRILTGTPGITHDQALVALQHHERVDGSGYPLGVKSEKISYWSKIVGVVDVFHAMSTKRVYHEAKPIHAVLQEMNQGKFGAFDVRILSTFLLKMMQSLIGKRLRLSDGRIGEVVLIYENNPTRPLVRCDADFVDLSQNYGIELMELIPDEEQAS